MTPRWRLACGWITLFVVGTDLFVISPLMPLIGTEFNQSAGATGLSVTVFSLAYLLTAPFIGYVADRTGRRGILMTCLAGFAAANVLTGISPDLHLLLGARIVAGATAAGISPLIYAGVNDAAPPATRATWMAIAVSGLLMALSIGTPAGTMIASYWGWRAPFIGIALLSMVLIVANRLVWPADPSRGTTPVTSAAVPDPRIMVLRLLPTLLWATALYGVYTYLGVWLTSSGRSSGEIALSVGWYGVGALLGTLVGGWAADRFGTRKTQLISLGGLAACLSALAAGLDAGWQANVLLLIMSAFAQLFFPAQQAVLARRFPQRRAFLLALNNSALFLGISCGSFVGGEAIAWGGFPADALVGAMIAFAGLMLVARTTQETLWREQPAPV